MRTLLALAVAAGLVAGADLLPGVIDTVGGTTFDNQNSGPSLQWLINDPDAGIHVTWMFSATTGTSFPDRTMRYNFYDPSTPGWNWIDPSYMQSGMDSQNRRTGYGTMAVDPTDGAEVIACHYNAGGMPPVFTPTVVRDLAPGAGIFDECVGDPTLRNYFLPVVGVTLDRTVHLFIIAFQSIDNLYYTRSTSWCNWENPQYWQQAGASGHNLAASSASNKVLATWMTGNNESLALGWRLSTDAGATWGDIQHSTPPSAFGGDTGTVCSRGASVIFDRNDDWLLATTLLPVIGDSAYTNPARLAFYSSATDNWSFVHRAEATSPAGTFGSHAAICDRPSIGQNPTTGRLFCAWEEFDPTNVETSTGWLRADIWLAWSEDGTTWSDPVRITEADQSSKRFPHLGANCSGDSLAIAFEQDLIAGFYSDEVGAISNNPICVWRGQASGIAERPGSALPVRAVAPNPGVRFSLSLPGTARLVELFDPSGRLVRELTAADGRADWDGTDATGRRVQPGIYVARWTTAGKIGQAKLVVAD